MANSASRLVWFVRFVAIGIVMANHAAFGDPPNKDKPVRIVTLGDSITKGVRPGVKAEETFAHQLQAALKKDGIAAEVINVGIGGEDTAQALKRLDKAVIALKPHVVTIMYGTNDSYIDKGKRDVRIRRDDFRKNLRALVEQLRKAGIEPILMTAPRLGDKHGENGAGEHPNKPLAEYMDICREVAHDTKTPLVDHFAHWTKQNAARTDIGTWTTDQCHPNAKGHEEIMRLMLPAVLKVIRQH
jgi:lysophospholipase L1-like esterase